MRDVHLAAIGLACAAIWYGLQHGQTATALLALAGLLGGYHAIGGGGSS